MAEDRDRENPDDVIGSNDEATIGSADDEFEDMDELDDDEDVDVDED